MAIKDILTLVSVLLGFVTSVLIPSVIVMINRIKAVKAAKTEAEKQAAISDIKTLAQNFIVEAENLYKDIEHSKEKLSIFRRDAFFWPLHLPPKAYYNRTTSNN